MDAADSEQRQQYLPKLHAGPTHFAMTAAILLLLRFFMPDAGAPDAAALVAEFYALGGIVCLMLLSRERQRGPGGLGQALSVTAVVLLLLAVDPLTRELHFALPRLALTLLLICATIQLLAGKLPRLLALTIVILLTAAPLWAAPLIELNGNPPWLNALVVSASPLTSFAVALDHDYLRSEWWYAHSALGSMRYSYPAWITVMQSLALPAVILLLVSVRPHAPGFLPGIRKEVHTC